MKGVKRKIPIRLMGKRVEQHDELIKTAKKEFREFVFVRITTILTAVFLFM